MVACSVGEVLWDIFPNGELFGGAALNFCANLRRLGEQAVLISAVGEEEHGRMALERMRKLGLTTTGVSVVSGFPTGTATVTTGDDGEPLYRIPRPAAFDRVSVPSELLQHLKTIGVDWLYYGTLLQMAPETEHLTTKLLQQLHPARGFYDINLRTGHWNLPLVQRLSHLASVMKLNEAEAAVLFEKTHPVGDRFVLEEFCEEWALTYGIDVMCVTLGPGGCLIYDRGGAHRIAGYRVKVRDTVGSGDAFAAAFLHGYQAGWDIDKTARFSNAVGALVASMEGATPVWQPGDVQQLFGDADLSEN
jgi:fructokinase